MASGIKSAGVDLDTIFAAYVGLAKPAATGIESAGSDLINRYTKLSFGTAAAATHIKSAGSDLNTIFAASGTVLQALTLFPEASASSVLSTAAALATSNPGGTQNAFVAVDTNGTGYSEMRGLGNNQPWAAAGSIGSPTGKGFLWDSTVLAGTSIPAGNWTFTYGINGGSSSDPANITIFIVDVYMRAYKRSSGGSYTAIASSVQTGVGIQNNLSSFHTVTATVAAGAVSFASGDHIYLDVWVDITTNLTSSPFASELQLIYTVAGTDEANIVTPGYVIA